MRFGSLFSGIGGFDLGFERVGMKCAWQVEIDKNCNTVLAHHWPDVNRYGDVSDVGKRNLEPVDLISGGFPCQDLSVAGRRAGLAGERSGLWFQFARIVEEMEPEWVVVENVPGLFSSNGGDDFAVIVGTLEQFGYCVAWRVLNSQYFGVPQRRRRVFIVGSLGSGGSVEVLFEREGGEGDIAESRETGEGIAFYPTGGTRSVCASRGLSPALKVGSGLGIPSPPAIVGAVSSKWHKGSGGPAGDEAYNLIVPDKAFCLEPLQGRGVERDKDTLITYTIQTNDGGEHRRKDRPEGGMYVKEADKSLALGSSDQIAITQSVGVRRLIPLECERLQSFPDNWTEMLSDTQRYKALGNAVTVNVVEWLGKRITKIAG